LRTGGRGAAVLDSELSRRAPLRAAARAVWRRAFGVVGQSLRSASKYVRQGRFGELFFRGKLHAWDAYNCLRYDLANLVAREKYRVIRTDDFRMYVHLSDKGISRDLYLYGGRERFALQFLKTFLIEDDVVLDIGANIGYYALVESAIARKGKVFASEPSAFNRRLLKMNIDLNKAANVCVYPFAFAEKSEEGREFYVYDRTNWASFNKDLDSEILATTQVRTITIDEFTRRYLGGLAPSAMRMDVEGYEYEIVKGAQRTLAESRNLKIFMEIHPHILSARQLDELLHTLESNRFEVRAIVNECAPHVYGFLGDKIWRSMPGVRYGMLGAGYEKLRTCLRVNAGTEVFFEKSA
jgi:FkbM family methyltransferase